MVNNGVPKSPNHQMTKSLTFAILKSIYMKKILWVTIVAAGLFACNSTDKQAADTDKTTVDTVQQSDVNPTANTDSTSVQWLDSTHINLGKVKEGKEVEISFRFRNSGSSNLIISSVSAQCGCTIPEQPKEPYASGQEGVIKAKFNGSGSGQIRKEVYVNSNTGSAPRQTLTFSAEIIK